MCRKQEGSHSGQLYSKGGLQERYKNNIFSHVPLTMAVGFKVLVANLGLSTNLASSLSTCENVAWQFDQGGIL